ncbi:MAG: GGDEF domain-containing protein [Lachnospiraceae bacterium]|nr:GGDEF domain-containing protein [Lachnospiraceae bacterium]
MDKDTLLIDEKFKDRILNTMASIYNSVHVMNIDEDTFVEVQAAPAVHNFIGTHGNISKAIVPIFQVMCSSDYLPRLLEFMDMKTLPDRMRNVNFISFDFLGNLNGYTQAAFIALSRHEDGRAKEVLFTTMIVEGQMRQNLEYRDVIMALSSVYFTTIKINLKRGVFQAYRIPEFLSHIFGLEELKYSDYLSVFLDKCVDQKYHSSINKFMEYETLADRLKENTSLSIEYHGVKMGWCRIILVPSRRDKDDNIVECVMAIEDIDEAKKREEMMTFKAEHDGLTGILNRAAYDNLVKNLSTVTFPIALMVMDVDKFKSINDTYGHDIGDVVLQHVSSLLKGEFRASDYVVRLGGDEFAVIMTNFPSQDADRIVEKVVKINHILQNPEGDLPKTSISVGVAFSDCGFGDDLFKRSDIALYHTKNTTRCGCTIYAKNLPDMRRGSIPEIDS